jgi:hypothetical protein
MLKFFTSSINYKDPDLLLSLKKLKQALKKPQHLEQLTALIFLFRPFFKSLAKEGLKPVKLLNFPI